MADQFPDPLTPPDCDLRGMEWMPLYGTRLFGSDFDAHATDSEFRAGMQLWWASWNQVPAASLPDDEPALCKLAGLGKDIKSWRRVRARAIHGFTKCSDGRLYHRALAHFACESWERRLKDRERKAQWREQRARRAERDKDEDESGTGRGRRRGQNADGDVPATTDETRRDATRRDATHNPDSESDAAADARACEREPATEVRALDAWNVFAKAHGLPTADFPTGTRIFAIATVLKVCGGAEGWNKGLKKAETAMFLRGADGRFHGWFKLDWLLKGDHFPKLLEGDYDKPREINGAGRQGTPGETWDQKRIRESREAVRNA